MVGEVGWGSVTTSSSVRNAVSRFCNTKDLQIKRKTVCNSDGHVKRWWFIIHAPENVLLNLDAAWGQLQLQTGWKLELCFKPITQHAPSAIPSPHASQPHNGTPIASSEQSSVSHASLSSLMTIRLQDLLHPQ